MTRKHRSLTSLGLILIISLNAILAACSLPASQEDSRSLEAAMDLRTAAHGILFADDEDSAVLNPAHLTKQLNSPSIAADPKEQILVRLINETKAEYNQVHHACQGARQQLSAQNAQCELKLLNQQCNQEKVRLQARLAMLRRWRGDRRRAFTRMWHGIKRAGRSVWHRLGPGGRSFFRGLEKDVVQTVVSGGTLGGGVFRQLFMNRLRSTLRQQGEAAIARGLDHMIRGRAASQASTSGNCDEILAEVQSEDSGAAQESKEVFGIDLGEWSFADDDCSDEPWVDELWPKMEARLQEEQKACQLSYIGNYRDCWQRAEREGKCPAEALEVCADLYEAIPGDITSGSGLTGLPSYTWEVSQMTFSFAPGSADGRINVERTGGIDDCRYRINVSLQGSFNYSTCSFSGTGTYSWTGEEAEMECLVLGDKGEIIGKPIRWEAELENNEIRGTVWEDVNDGFSFKVPLE